MHCIHGFAFALSIAAMVVLVFALPVSWYQAHAEPSKTRAITPYARPVDVDVSLWHLSETHHRLGERRHVRGTWQLSPRGKQQAHAPFCPMKADSPSNMAAHNAVAVTSGLAIMAAVLCQGYIVLGLLYATNRLRTRVGFVTAGVLTALCAVAAATLWIHFTQMCGEHQCARIGSGSNPAEDYRMEDYVYTCGLGLGVLLEFVAPVLLLVSLALFVVQSPASSTVTYEAVKTSA